MSELLTVTGLGRRYVETGLFKHREFHAVCDVSFTLQRGEILGVVGESGCGKSTLARLILRLIEPSSGHVRFEGQDITALQATKMRRLRRHMQLVFQDPYSSIDPRFSIQDALLEPYHIQGVALDSADQTVTSLLDMVGLGGAVARRYPHQLSGGQKQRVSIARALALKPSLLVLDEPTASLDVSIQAQIIGLLDRLRVDNNLTYIFISHDLSLVNYFCRRILVMYLGRIVEVLPSRAPPAHPYTRALQDSIFEPDPRKRRTVACLSGDVPSGYNPPPGCAFAARCSSATDICRKYQPALSKVSDGRQVACYHPLLP